MTKLFLIKEKLCIFIVSMETKLWENVVAYIVDFLIVCLINVLIFKVITLHTCCPLESNELTVYVESSSCLDSAQWSHMLKSFGSTQIEQIPGPHSVFLGVLQTHIIHKEKIVVHGCSLQHRKLETYRYRLC